MAYGCVFVFFGLGRFSSQREKIYAIIDAFEMTILDILISGVCIFSSSCIPCICLFPPQISTVVVRSECISFLQPEGGEKDCVCE